MRDGVRSRDAAAGSNRNPERRPDVEPSTVAFGERPEPFSRGPSAAVR
jgi:hypothetical protein